MKAQEPRLLTVHRFTVIAVTSVMLLLSPFAGQAKDHVDLQFWDMIWGGPEYIDAGKALVAQFNQEHPEITVTYRSIPFTNLVPDIRDRHRFWNCPGP
jgi:multiple sugar transport system substrate-binding protein